MKNTALLFLCAFAFVYNTFAQVSIVVDPAPVAGRYSKVYIDTIQSPNIQSVQWNMNYCIIDNIYDMYCDEESPTTTCTTNAVNSYLWVLWDCMPIGIPTLTAYTTDIYGNEEETVITAQTFSAPTILVEEQNYCLKQASIFSANLLQGIDAEYVWRVEGEASRGANIKTDANSEKSLAEITWEEYGNATVSLSIIMGDACELYTIFNNPITIKENPDKPIINGTTQVCSTGLVNYNITPEVGVIEYKWRLPLYAADNATGFTSAVTTTPNLTVKFDEKFNNGEMTVTAFNSCGGSATNSIMLYNGDPNLKNGIEGNASIYGKAERAFSLKIPNATWYEWHISGRDSTIASFIGDVNQEQIYVYFDTPLDTNDHYVTIQAKAYDQEGNCPLASAQRELTIQPCDEADTYTQNYNHNKLLDANNFKILGELKTNYCVCPIATANALNISTSLDIRCPVNEDLDVPATEDDRDYMFGTATLFNLLLDAELLLYDIETATNATTPIAIIPFTFNLNPNNPQQKFNISIKSGDFGLGYVEDIKKIRVRVKTYCFNQTGLTGCEDGINVTGNDGILELMDDCITFNLNYNYDLQYDVRNSTVQLSSADISTSGATVEAIFNWQLVSDLNRCPVNNYEFQLLKLYPVYFQSAGGSSGVYGDEHNIKIHKPDWSKALTIETQSSHTSLKLTLTEGNGPYIWRVRPIGNNQANGAGNDDNWGVWSNKTLWSELNNLLPTHLLTVNNGCLKINGDDNCITLASGTNIPDCFDVTQFDNDKNWIYSRTFAEGNTDRNEQVRIGEQITYANKLLQGIQTQSQLTQTPGSPSSILGSNGQPISGDVVVVSQTEYDFTGRPALQSIATPTDATALGYNDNILPGYDATKFDNGPLPSPITEGQINTYFDNSTDPQIPSTENYPFSRTLFYPDGTNRVKEQGGIGTAFQVGTEHTTRTSYAAASDNELIRLFGDEAPSYKSVYKVSQTDPNGVKSISYIDLSGKTIATCLGGSNAQAGALVPLNDVPTSDYFTISQNVTSNIWQDASIVSGTTITFDHDLDATNLLTISYNLDLNSIQNQCLNWCATCRYQLLIILTSTIDNTVTVVNAQNPIPLDNICSATPPTPDWTTGSITIPQSGGTIAAGTYTITKYLIPMGATLNTPTPPGNSDIQSITDLAQQLNTSTAQGLYDVVVCPQSSLPPLAANLNLPTYGVTGGNITVATLLAFLEDIAAGSLNDSNNPNDPQQTGAIDPVGAIFTFYQTLNFLADQTQTCNTVVKNTSGGTTVSYTIKKVLS